LKRWKLFSHPLRGKVLKRTVGVPGAVVLGLGSIIGTGIFVVSGIGYSMVGAGVFGAIIIAGLLAACNGFNSAQLAAAHPVSGGSYEYGYRLLHPLAGFSAGVLFLLAKSASAATACLVVADIAVAFADAEPLRRSVSVAIIVLLTVLVVSGLRRSNVLNAVVVAVSTGAVVLAALWALAIAVRGGTAEPTLPEHAFVRFEAAVFFEACALIFVGYTGYGRIATMGEEVSEPRRSIPRAMAATLLIAAGLYVLMGVYWLAGGSGERMPGARLLVEAAIPVALLGVVLNLVLGLSRMVLAMARRGDLPPYLAGLDGRGEPVRAIIAVGIAVALLTLIGDSVVAWSLSACAVLLYYGVANAAALRLPPEQRLYGKWLGWLGLGGCAFLAFWVESAVVLVVGGTLLLAAVLRRFIRGWNWFPNSGG